MSELDTFISQLASATVADDEEVSFSGRSLKLDTEEDAQDIVEAIKNCPGMTVLRLDGNTIGVEAAKAIAKALESRPKFKKALWKDMFTQRTEREIPDALNYLSSGIMLANSRLVVLDLSDNAFGPRGLKGIVNLLKSSACFTLQELYLNNNGLGISGAKMLAGALQQCLSQSESGGYRLNLKVFVCGRNRLENEGSLALSEFLKAVGSLEHIAMPQNGIGYEGIAGLAEAFSANPHLKILNLEDNILTEKGASLVSNQLHLLNSLKSINLGDCLVKTKGAKYIADALNHSCPELKELLLGFNEIQREGGIAIVNSIKDKKHLDKLVLNGNQFGSEGCEMIQEMMKSYHKAEQLASLSEDESDDGEDEHENESENEVSSTEITSVLNGSIHTSPLEQKQYTFSSFLDSPSGEVLCGLFELKKSIFEAVPHDITCREYFDIFIKIAQLVKPGDEKVFKAACHFADELLCTVFESCPKGEMWKLNNDFVVAIKLIKDESKNPSMKEDLTGIFLVLQHAVRQTYFHESTKNLLQVLLSKPLRLGHASHLSVNALLQTLYQA